MKYLLDTHIYLWWLSDSKKLVPSIRKEIENTDNTIFVSIVSFWEISIKLQLNKLPLKTSFHSLYENLQFNLLPLTIEHIFSLQNLPIIHKDPFDRILIAQAETEKLTLITNDTKIAKYGRKIL